PCSRPWSLRCRPCASGLARSRPRTRRCGSVSLPWRPSRSSLGAWNQTWLLSLRPSRSPTLSAPPTSTGSPAWTRLPSPTWLGSRRCQTRIRTASKRTASRAMSSAPIIYPGGAYRQLARKSRVPLAPRIINVHTMVGTLGGTEGYFAGDGRPYSHFGTGGSGEVRQWQDLRYRAASDLNGNPYCISIENEDTGPLFPRWSGSDVPRFTDKQADALVMLLSWLCHRFGLPRSAITTSCPHERGIGYHRLGVNPYRNTDCGHLWSSAYGKACPGNRRIHQLVHEIIPRVSAPGSTPGGPVTDAVSRTSAIHLTGRLAGLTAAEIREVLDRGADAMPADLSLRAIRSDLAR